MPFVCCNGPRGNEAFVCGQVALNLNSKCSPPSWSCMRLSPTNASMPHCPLQQMNGATPYLRLSRLCGKTNAFMQHCDFANECLHATLRLSKRMAQCRSCDCIANQEINAVVPHCDAANLDSRLAQLQIATELMNGAMPHLRLSVSSKINESMSDLQLSK